jgi:hypothetical protein
VPSRLPIIWSLVQDDIKRRQAIFFLFSAIYVLILVRASTSNILIVLRPMAALQRIKLVAEPGFPYGFLLGVDAVCFVLFPGLNDTVPVELPVRERGGVRATAVKMYAIGPVIGADRMSGPKIDLIYLPDVICSNCACRELCIF